MRLLKSKDRQATAGLPPSHREWWNISGGFEVYISIGKKECCIAIDTPEKKDITYEVASLLGVDTNPSNIRFAGKSEGRELYLTYSIDCFVLNYTKPENYKELLEKIEKIINEHFKKKSKSRKNL